MAQPHTSSHLSTFVVCVTMAAYWFTPIQTCPVNCTCPADPVSVICSGQGFTSIPENLPKNTVTLNLSYNKITVLDLRALYDLKSLERIDISSNEIKTIHGSFESFKNLTLINLSQNKIEAISWTTFGKLSQMTRLKLGGNPFNCDCNQWDIHLCDCSGDIFSCTCNIQWLKEQMEKYPNLDRDVTCQNPAAVRGKAIEKVIFIPHWCETKYQAILGGTVSAFIVLIMACAVLCRLKRRQLRSCLETCSKCARHDDTSVHTSINTESTAKRLYESISPRLSEAGEQEAAFEDNAGNSGSFQGIIQATDPKAKRGSAIDLEDLIKRNYPLLRKRLQVSDLFPHLIQRGLLQIEEKEGINSKTTREGKAEALLDLLGPQGKCTCDEFVEILRIGKHAHIVGQLK